MALLDRAGEELERQFGGRVNELEGELAELAREGRIARGINAMQEAREEKDHRQRHAYYEQAIALFRGVLVDPEATEDDRVRVLGNLARAEKRVGQIAEAKGHIEERIALRPADDLAIYNLACYTWLLHGEDSIDEVLALLSRCEELVPGSVVEHADHDEDFKALILSAEYQRWKEAILRNRPQSD